MTAALPVRKMSHPADLDGCTNGVINPAVHVAVALADGTRSTMHHAAAAALLAMDAVLFAATGFRLGSVGMFRTIAVGRAGFLRSYLDHYDPARCTLDHQRQWEGKTWYLLKGTIPKATPGKTEHGWGLANDCTLWRNGTEYAIGDRRARIAFEWLVTNAPQYGFHWAYPTPGVDDPHLQYTAGDSTPPAMKAPTPTPPRVGATIPNATIRLGDEGPNVAALQTILAARHLYTKRIDGKAGPATIAALKQLQRELGFVGRMVDGIYGPETRARLAAAH